MMSSKLPGFLCLAGLLFVSAAASAQNLQEKPLPSLLTPQSQSVLDKLATLSALPKPDWRYHAGDMEHGESPSLDDAGWQAAGSTLPPEAIWMRATIEVPKTLNGYD